MGEFEKMSMEQIVIDISYFLVHDLYQNLSYFAVFMFMLTPKYNKAAMRIAVIVMMSVSICCYIIVTTLPTPIFWQPSSM